MFFLFSRTLSEHNILHSAPDYRYGDVQHNVRARCKLNLVILLQYVGCIILHHFFNNNTILKKV